MAAADGCGGTDKEGRLFHLRERHYEPAAAVELDIRVRGASCEGFLACHCLPPSSLGVPGRPLESEQLCVEFRRTGDRHLHFFPVVKVRQPVPLGEGFLRTSMRNSAALFAIAVNMSEIWS